MALKIEAITMIPALVLAMVAVYISFFALITPDPYIKKLSMLFAVSLFFGGVAMAICWVLYWAIHKKIQ